MLTTRGKAHEIISHTLEDDPDVKWPTTKKKLISNYGLTKSRIDVSLKLDITMTDDETVCEYLVHTRILVKTKLGMAIQWNTE